MLLVSYFEERFGKPNFVLRKALRINPLKAKSSIVSELKKRGILKEQVPWYKWGFFFEGDVSKEFEAGQVYIQDASSMLPPTWLGIRKGDVVLDMAASPGSKAQQMAAMGAKVVANEPNTHRREIMKRVFEKFGGEFEVLDKRGEDLWRLGHTFNKILLDAPCTDTGTFSKKAIEQFTPAKLKRMIALQKKLVKSAFKMLEPRGTLVYSTCSLAEEENEKIIEYAQKFGFKLVRSRRIHPSEFGSEGFFTAELRKPL